MLGKTDELTKNIVELDHMHHQLNEITRYLEMLKKQRTAIDQQIENFTKMHHNLSNEIMNIGK